jgi:hypothetical protein
MHGPIAEVPTADGSGIDAALGDQLARDEAEIAPPVASSGSCSAQPGCGTSILCGREAWATISPAPSTSTPFGFEGPDIDKA